MHLDIQRAVYFPFSDPNWVSKILIATAMVVLPFVGLGLIGMGSLAFSSIHQDLALFIAITLASVAQVPLLAWSGYWMNCTRRVAQDDPVPLPDWRGLPGYLWHGLVGGLGISLILSLALLPSGMGACLTSCVMNGGRLALGTITIQIGSSPLLLGLGALLLLGGALLAFPIFLISPLMVLAYARTWRLAETVRFGSMLKAILARPVDYLVVLFVPGLVNMVILTLLGFTVIGYVLYPVVWIYVSLVTAHLLGQFSRAFN